jgi:hypothetical protein
MNIVVVAILDECVCIIPGCPVAGGDIDLVDFVGIRLKGAMNVLFGILSLYERIAALQNGGGCIKQHGNESKKREPDNKERFAPKCHRGISFTRENQG